VTPTESRTRSSSRFLTNTLILNAVVAYQLKALAERQQKGTSRQLPFLLLPSLAKDISPLFHPLTLLFVLASSQTHP